MWHENHANSPCCSVDSEISIIHLSLPKHGKYFPPVNNTENKPVVNQAVQIYTVSVWVLSRSALQQLHFDI